MNDTQYDKALYLTPCEMRVLLLLAEGKKTCDIADEPGHRCSTRTIDTQVKSMGEVLGLSGIIVVRHFAVHYKIWLDNKHCKLERNTPAKMRKQYWAYAPK